MTVNHGGPVCWQATVEPGRSGGAMVHVPSNLTGHHNLKSGERCECGVLGLGVLRLDSNGVEL